MFSRNQEVKETEKEKEEEEEAHPLLQSYGRMQGLLKGLDEDSQDWSADLQEEVNSIGYKKGLLNRIHVRKGGEFFEALKDAKSTPYDPAEFDVEEADHDDARLDTNLGLLLSTVELAQARSDQRAQKLQASFVHLQAVQKAMVEKEGLRFEGETGLTRLQARVLELQNQQVKLRAALVEKKKTIVLNDKEAELTPEELRRKYEGEMQGRGNKLRRDMAAKSAAMQEAASQQVAMEQMCEEVRGDLQLLLKDLEDEEQNPKGHFAKTDNPIRQFRASIIELRGEQSEGAEEWSKAQAGRGTTSIFGDSFDGLISDQHVQDAQRAHLDMLQTHAGLVSAEEGLQAIVQGQGLLLEGVDKTEEAKMLERLKRRTVDQQAKIDSDEKRILALQLELDIKDSERDKAKAEMGGRHTRVDLQTAGAPEWGRADDSGSGGSSSEGEKSQMPFDFGGEESFQVASARKTYAKYFEEAGSDSDEQHQHRGRSSQD
ncbi:hypothetical protein B484DRAFT_425607, partial [Ochromonadaceae sp. CCMP2298]